MIDDIELEYFSHNSITYGFVTIDSDYIDYKFKYPTTNDKVVVIDTNILLAIEIVDDDNCLNESIIVNYLDDNNCLKESKCCSENFKIQCTKDDHKNHLFNRIALQISSWQNMDNSSMSHLYFFSVFVFPVDTDDLDIIEVVRDFVITHATNRFNPIPIDQKFTNNIIDYKEMIVIDMQNYCLFNY